MSTTPSKFVWYELMTSDPQAAEAFYREVIGWSAADAGMPDRRYTILSIGKTAIGGLMALPPEVRDAGGRPGWIGYIAAGDVDRAAAQVAQGGGAVHRAAEDIPGVGRFAVVGDPQGAAFVLFKGNSDAAPEQPAAGTPGTVGWHELVTLDREAAFKFYSALCGWTKSEAIDMGPMGIYQLFAAGGDAIGGMMNKPAEVPAPFWLYYVNVAAVDAAIERVKDGGGRIINGPMQVPGGSWIVQCLDPQGAMFAMVAPTR